MPVLNGTYQHRQTFARQRAVVLRQHIRAQVRIPFQRIEQVEVLKKLPVTLRDTFVFFLYIIPLFSFSICDADAKQALNIIYVTLQRPAGFSRIAAHFHRFSDIAFQLSGRYITLLSFQLVDNDQQTLQSFRSASHTRSSFCLRQR